MQDTLNVIRTRGVVYIARSKDAFPLAERSMASLWATSPALPALVVGDGESLEFRLREERIECRELELATDFREQIAAPHTKALLAQLSPYDATLYVDAATHFQRSPDYGFRLLESWDIVLLEETPQRTSTCVRGAGEFRAITAGIGPPDRVRHSMNMIFWRRSSVVSALFSCWTEELTQLSDANADVAFENALARSDAVFQTVPHSWYRVATDLPAPFDYILDTGGRLPA